MLQEAMIIPGEVTCVYYLQLFLFDDYRKLVLIYLLCSAAIPATRPISRAELSNKFRDHFGYTLDIKPSGIPHKDAGQGLFLSGEANVGAVLAVKGIIVTIYVSRVV